MKKMEIPRPDIIIFLKMPIEKLMNLCQQEKIR